MLLKINKNEIYNVTNKGIEVIIFLTLIGLLFGYFYGSLVIPFMLKGTYNDEEKKDGVDIYEITYFVAIPTSVMAPFVGEMFMGGILGDSFLMTGFFGFLETQPDWITYILYIVTALAAIFCFKLYIIIPLLFVIASVFRFFSILRKYKFYTAFMNHIIYIFKAINLRLGVNAYQQYIMISVFIVLTIYIFFNN